MKQMRFAVILILFTLLLAGTAHAQTDVLINTVQVQLWPEYDRPSMLVIYTLELAPEQTLPAQVSIRIPASVGEPMAVAVLETAGLITREYNRTVEGDWATITLQADFPVIQVEYYDPALSQADPQRSYNFTWESDFPVSDFILSVKQPLNATGFITSPDLGEGQTASDGLLTYTGTFGSLAANQTVNLSINYTKNDTTLAVQGLSGQSSTGTTPSQTTGSFPVWGWVLIGVGTVVLVGGGIFFIRINRPAPVSSYKTRKTRSAAASSTRKPAQSGIFCHQCGAPAQAGDKFCRECGTKLRL